MGVIKSGRGRDSLAPEFTKRAHGDLKMFDDGLLVIISPHPDDAVYSLGGCLGGRCGVRVLTVCSGLPDLGAAPTNYDLLTKSDDPYKRMAARIDEDRAACETMGWSVDHLGYLDSPYRDTAHDVEAMEGDILDALPQGAFTLLVPAGIGSHPDHVTVRDVAISALPKINCDEVYVYADYPYAAYYGWPHWITGKDYEYLSIDSYYERSLSSMRKYGLGDPMLLSLTESQVDAKIEAMKQYRTQFDAMEMGPSRTLTHPERVRYELCWPLSRG